MGVETPLQTPSTNYPVPYQTIWDLRPKKYKNVIVQVCLFILMMELAERLSYYGINQGLKNFMQKIGWSAVSASSLKSTWTSICYLSPLLGAYIADEKWGRFKTILVFGIWYACGDFLVAISAHPSIMQNEALVNPIFIIGLFLGIGVGTGAIKSNVITLGADQFDPNDPSEVVQKETYFGYFYFCINLGACVAYGYLSILSVDGSSLIPAEYGYFATYMICAVVMVLALVCLVIGYRRYVHVPPRVDALSQLFSVISGSARFSIGAAVVVAGFASFMLAFVVNMISAFMSDEGQSGSIMSYVAGGLVLIGIICWVYHGMDASFMDVAKISHGGGIDDTTVNDIKKVIRVLPYASFTIIWQCAYDQTDANFQSITQQCDLRLDTSDPDSAQVPGAMLGVFDPISILIIIPILDTLIYPLYRKITGKAPSAFGKTLAGLIVATFALFWAGIFETIRKNSGELPGPIYDKGSDQPMNRLYWVAAIPNYVLIAIAECLINVTAYDVFYSEVPLHLKSLCQAINLFMTSMGSIAASIFTIMFGQYIPSNLNEGNLEYMYYFVGLVSVINLFFFVIVMRKMKFGMEKKESDDDMVQLLDKVSISSRTSFANGK